MPSNSATSERVNRGAMAVGAVIAVIVVLAAIVWWQRETFAEWLGISDDAESAGPEVGVNLSEVSDHPEALYGRRVIVSADVENVVGPNAMIIGSDEFVVGDEVLVVSRSPLGSLPSAVQVTGEVRRYQPDELAQDLGIDLAGVDYGGDAVIVASQITDAPPPTVPGDTEEGATSAGPDVGVTINDITDGDISDLIGQEVTVSGEIERIVSPHAIRFGDAMLLAVGPMEETPFIEAMAEVTGVVATFDVREAQGILGIDLDEAALSEFEGEPVILVRNLDVVR